MRSSIYVLAAVALTSFAGAGAQGTGSQGTGGQSSQSQGAQGSQNQNTGNPNATPGAQAPVRQPATPRSPTTPAPSSQTSPTPSQPPQSSSQVTTPNQTQQTMPNSSTTPNQTVLPPGSDLQNRDSSTNNSMNNATQPNPIPPASRGVGTSGNRPDCSKKRGLEKSECERRDTVRDDLPAGVTTTQPKSPPQ